MDTKTTSLAFQLPRETAVHLAAAKEPGRYAFHQVLVDPVSGCAVATNGRILARVPITVNEDELPQEEQVQSLIPQDILKAASKEYKRNPDPVLRVDPVTRTVESNIRGSGQVHDLGAQEDFPAWDRVLPEEQHDDKFLSIDADLLATLAKAIGSGGIVTLRIPDSNLRKGRDYRMAPIEVRVSPGDFGDVEKAQGVIMPCSVEAQ